MGFDVSWHPISEAEMEAWYFARLDEVRAGHTETARALAAGAGMEDFYAEKYLDTLKAAAQTEPDAVFESTHGLYLAAAQGFFAPFFYTRGAAFSFLIEEDPALRTYAKPWEEMLPRPLPNPIKNIMYENYCCGVYLPPEGLRRLLEDCKRLPELQARMEKTFSHGRLSVFEKAARAALEQERGLLEATELIEPDPLDLNKSVCYSNLFHCDTEGPLLYAEAVAGQLAEIHRERAVQAAKKGFLSKLFGKK